MFLRDHGPQTTQKVLAPRKKNLAIFHHHSQYMSYEKKTFLKSPYNWVGFHPLYNPNNQGPFFHCSYRFPTIHHCFLSNTPTYPPELEHCVSICLVFFSYDWRTFSCFLQQPGRPRRFQPVIFVKTSGCEKDRENHRLQRALDRGDMRYMWSFPGGYSLKRGGRIPIVFPMGFLFMIPCFPDSGTTNPTSFPQFTPKKQGEDTGQKPCFDGRDAWETAVILSKEIPPSTEGLLILKVAPGIVLLGGWVPKVS